MAGRPGSWSPGGGMRSPSPRGRTRQRSSRATGQRPGRVTGQPGRVTGQPRRVTGQPPARVTGLPPARATGQPPARATGLRPGRPASTHGRLWLSAANCGPTTSPAALAPLPHLAPLAASGGSSGSGSGSSSGSGRRTARRHQAVLIYRIYTCTCMPSFAHFIDSVPNLAVYVPVLGNGVDEMCERQSSRGESLPDLYGLFWDPTCARTPLAGPSVPALWPRIGVGRGRAGSARPGPGGAGQVGASRGRAAQSLQPPTR